MGPLMRGLRREEFRVVLLDSKNAIIKDVRVSEGSLTLSTYTHEKRSCRLYAIPPRRSFLCIIIPAGTRKPAPRIAR